MFVESVTGDLVTFLLCLLAATQVRCAVMESYADGTLSVRMFLGTRQGGLTCLNEVLVNGNYATGTDGAYGKYKHAFYIQCH